MHSWRTQTGASHAQAASLPEAESIVYGEGPGLGAFGALSRRDPIWHSRQTTSTSNVSFVASTASLKLIIEEAASPCDGIIHELVELVIELVLVHGM